MEDSESAGFSKSYSNEAAVLCCPTFRSRQRCIFTLLTPSKCMYLIGDADELRSARRHLLQQLASNGEEIDWPGWWMRAILQSCFVLRRVVVAACSEANGRAVLCMCTLRNGQTECDSNSIPVRKAWPSARVRKQPSGARHWSRSAMQAESTSRLFRATSGEGKYVATKFPTCRL